MANGNLSRKTPRQPPKGQKYDSPGYQLGSPEGEGMMDGGEWREKGRTGEAMNVARRISPRMSGNSPSLHNIFIVGRAASSLL